MGLEDDFPIPRLGYMLLPWSVSTTFLCFFEELPMKTTSTAAGKANPDVKASLGVSTWRWRTTKMCQAIWHPRDGKMANWGGGCFLNLVTTILGVLFFEASNSSTMIESHGGMPFFSAFQFVAEKHFGMQNWSYLDIGRCISRENGQIIVTYISRTVVLDSIFHHTSSWKFHPFWSIMSNQVAAIPYKVNQWTFAAFSCHPPKAFGDLFLDGQSWWSGFSA